MLLMRKSSQITNRVGDVKQFINVPDCKSNSYTESDDLGTDTFYPINANDLFPRIDVKYLNKNAFTNNNKVTSFSNQNNYGQRIDEDDDEEDCIEELYSKVFIKDRSNNDIYSLEFKTTNVTLIPVYLKQRIPKANENDKCNQPKSTTVYENIYNNKARRNQQLVKSFKINKSGDDELSILSFRHPVMKKNAVEPPKPRKKKTISDPESNLKQSVIYITYKEMEFKIKPGLMNLRHSNLIDFEAEEKRAKLLKELHMELPLDVKNKAQIVTKYKGDILKFTFTLSEINCSKLKVTSSIGLTVKDESIYVKDYSSISSRKIYISLPKSTYAFVDGMVEAQQKNLKMKLNKIDPRWLVEQRKKRWKEYTQCRRKNPYDDLTELKIGSSICYESYNRINKVKGGTMPCTASDEKYEAWVQTIQWKGQTDSKGGGKSESMFGNNVPNWDLLLNTK